MPSIAFDSRLTLCIALASVAVVITIIASRRRLNTIPTWLLLFGALMLAFAAGAPTVSWQAAQSVVVRVDLSPSTRTAAYRDLVYLRRRISTLLGRTRFRVEFFANGLVPPPSSLAQNITTPRQGTLTDSPCDRTTYPPSDSVTLLFSDCQFDLPQSGQATYIALDAELADARDASVTGIDTTPGRSWVTTHVTAGVRTLSMTGASPTTAPALPGDISHPITIAAGATSVTAQLSHTDAWPENDVLTTALEQPKQSEKWWVGSAPAPIGWKQIQPADLPLEPEAYLMPTVIAVANVRADELDTTRQQRLAQYVKDLGGSLIILGGDHAFGAGGYYATSLDALSPLASNPPTPATQWIILVDASGSMSNPAAGFTRWNLATRAAVNLLPRIPPTDLVSIGGFADGISWWVQSQPARAVAAMTLPPPQSVPHGPTNLEPAIQNVADSLPGKLPARLLIISDFDTTISNPNALSASLSARQVHVDLLAIGQGSAFPAMRQISGQTTGNTLVSADPSQWGQSARDLLSAALPDRFETEPVSVLFTTNAINSASFSVPAWNRTWLKPDATLLAKEKVNETIVPMTARWNLGQGQVVSVAFNPPASILSALTDSIAATPRDPRITVTHQQGRELSVTVRAIDGNQFLNDLKPLLELRDAEGSSVASTLVIPQSAPGEYAIRVPAPRASQFARVILNGRTVDRFVVGGRYAPEFENIGNDRAAMDELARRTGGAVILPTQTMPIEITWPLRRLPVTSPMAITGVIVIGLALLLMRRHGSI